MPESVGRRTFLQGSLGAVAWALAPRRADQQQAVPTALLSALKELANKRDVPYQSLLKVFLAERVARETTSVRRLSRRALQPTKRAKRRFGKSKTSRAVRG